MWPGRYIFLPDIFFYENGFDIERRTELQLENP